MNPVRFLLVVSFSLCGLLASLGSPASPAAALGFPVGPGSYPPRCSSKCGGCSPCKAVHVAVPPGRPVIEEYYPEAWRCKCGGKLYVP